MQTRTSDFAVIWDKDGTLLDSEKYHWLCFVETYWRGFGKILPAELEHQTAGKKLQDLVPIWNGVLGIDCTFEHYDELLQPILVELIEIHLYAHGIDLSLVQLLDELQTQGVPLGIATSNRHKYVFERFERLGFFRWFAREHIVTYESCKLHKPHPDPLLLAAESLKIPPERCCQAPTFCNTLSETVSCLA